MNRNQIILLIAIAVVKAFLGLHQPTAETAEKSQDTEVVVYSGLQTVDPNRFRVSIDTLAQGNSRRDLATTEYFQKY